MKHFLGRGLVLLPLLWAACAPPANSPASSQPEPAVKSAAASEPQPTQVEAQQAESKPAAAPATPRTPATFEEILQAIDLRTLPKLEGAQVRMNKASWLTYSAPGRLAETVQLYRKKLLELGWTEDKSPIPGLDAERDFFAGFDKGGFRVSVSINKHYKKEGIVDVNIINVGNVDPRQLARQEDAKPTLFYRHYVSYTTAAKPEAAIEFCRKDLTGRGWQEFRVSGAKFFAKEGRYLLGFLNNSMYAYFNIKGEKDGSTVVECRVEVRDKPARLAAKDLPKPATLSEGRKVIDLNRFPRLEGVVSSAGSSAVVGYDAPGSVADALRFYRKKLTEQGWTEESEGDGDESSAMPRFNKAGFQLECFISKSDKDGRVNVQIENKGNVDARQLPRILPAEDGGLGSFGNVHYETGATVAAAADFYRKELTEAGWKEQHGKGGSMDYRNGAGKHLVFAQNACSLKIDIRPNSEGDVGVHIIPHLYGELIPRPGPVGAAVSVIDLRRFPRLKSNPASNATSAGVDYIVDGAIADAARFYRQELSKAGWQEQKPPIVENNDQAKLRFTKESYVVEVVLMTGEPRGVGIGVHNRGDLDTRELLHLDDAVLDDASVQESTRYVTAATVDAAIGFYRETLATFGWQLTKGPDAIPSHVEMEFVQKSMKLKVQITTNAEKKTEVRVDSWMLGQASTPADQPRGAGRADDKPRAAGPRPKELPIPSDAEDVEFNATAKMVRFKSPSSIRNLVDFYREELKKLGWTEDQKQRIVVVKDTGITTFKKGKASFIFRLNRRSDDIIEVMVICKGVEFE